MVDKNPYTSGVQTFDNFLEKDGLQKILNGFNNDQVWGFTGTSDKGSDISSRFWCANNLEEYEVFKKLWELIQTNCSLYKYKLTRCYANGQTACQSGTPHTDDGDLTVLFYPSEWKHIYGGHLHFIKNNRIGHVVEYIQNRLVIFPAHLLHYAGAPIKEYDGIRISVAFKLKEVNE
tara:strand:+ start:368 stop:895 length:528 start_codon:yes stop_codon:yes gene_type:complete